MKTKLLIATICMAVISVSVCAQSVTITPEEITYQRKGENLPDFKKEFTVRYPRFSGLSASATQNLTASVDYWKLFKTTLNENLSDYTWLEGFDYNVTYNKNYLLAIELSMEGSGAYPDGSTKRLLFDLRDGKRIYTRDVFQDIPGLLLKIDKEQKAEIARQMAEVKKDSGAKNAAELQRMIKEHSYSASKFEEFSVSDAGVVFYYDFGFPHAVVALQPSGTYFFSWRSMRGHVKRDSLLGKFIN